MCIFRQQNYSHLISEHVQHTTALCLSNLFLERSVKHQAHYFSRLETRKTQLASCETPLETRFSKFSKIENRVWSRVSRLASDCQLTFERYCNAMTRFACCVRDKKTVSFVDAYFILARKLKIGSFKQRERQSVNP